MRKVLELTVVLLILVLIPAVEGQQKAASFFTSVDPARIRFQPIDTGRAVRPDSINGAFRPTRASNSFSWRSVFSNLSMPSWPSKTAAPPTFQSNPFNAVPSQPNNIFSPPKKK